MRKEEIEIAIDLESVLERAEKAKILLKALRAEFDLERFEFTKKIRIAPLEVPHSHPVLTLNTQYVSGPEASQLKFLSAYLHEQFHWALEGYPKTELEDLLAMLRGKYPNFHRAAPLGAEDEASSYLHLIVNWLELNAMASLIGIGQARSLVLEFHHYRHIYQTVAEDYEDLHILYRHSRLIPFVSIVGG